MVSGTALTDIAVQIDNSLPPIVGQWFYAITATQNVITFDNSNPGIIRSQAAVTQALPPDGPIAGMDMRPATGSYTSWVMIILPAVSSCIR